MPKVQANGAGAGRRGRRVASSLAEINVVPLVDVMLVLLIIFMITAPMIQRGVDVNLPVARRSSQIAGERIFVSIPVNYRESHIVYLDQEGRGSRWVQPQSASYATIVRMAWEQLLTGFPT